MADYNFIRPTKAYEARALEFLQICQNSGSVHGTGGLDRYTNDYDGWLKKLANDREQVKTEKRVPAETFFLVRRLSGKYRIWAGYDWEIIGIANVRLDLNTELWNFGGHIGYMIQPLERGQGYGKLILFLSLYVCQQRGLDAVLVCCLKDNLASAKTIQALGGKLIYESGGPNIVRQNYVIDVDFALAHYGNEYTWMVPDYIVDLDD